MAAARLSDLIVPEVFNPYVVEQTTQLSAFWQSGIVANIDNVSPGNRGGALVHLPFFQDLTGADELLDEDDTLSLSNITADDDVAVVHARGKAWGATDLSAAFSGTDPMRQIGDRVADYWARRFQGVLIASLNGAMGAVGDNELDISGLSGAAAYLDFGSFVDATQLMGDARDRITAIAMHSATEASLIKADLIETVPQSEGKPAINTFNGRRVIVDDGMPVASGGVYTTYLFGQGAVAYANGNTPVPTETQREARVSGGVDELITRRHFVMHPRGIAWNPGGGVPAKQTPSNAELANPANWLQVYESKNIRIVRLIHKNAP